MSFFYYSERHYIPLYFCEYFLSNLLESLFLKYSFELTKANYT